MREVTLRTFEEAEKQLHEIWWDLQKMRDLLKALELVAMEQEESHKKLDIGWCSLIGILLSQTAQTKANLEPLEGFLTTERREEQKRRHIEDI